MYDTTLPICLLVALVLASNCPPPRSGRTR